MTTRLVVAELGFIFKLNDLLIWLYNIAYLFEKQGKDSFTQ